MRRASSRLKRIEHALEPKREPVTIVVCGASELDEEGAAVPHDPWFAIICDGKTGAQLDRREDESPADFMARVDRGNRE